MKSNIIIPDEIIERKIFIIRGVKVLLDKDIAELYKVNTSYLNKQVKRNIDRFPADFMFQLNYDEFKSLMFHFGISKRGGTRKNPCVFTDNGIAMLSGILKSKRAINVNIQIMRVFTKLHKYLLTHKVI